MYAGMHVCNQTRQNTHAIMQSTKARQKNYNRSIIIYTHALNISLLAGHGATTFIQRKPQDRKGQNWTSWVFIVHGAVETAKAPRGRAGYLPPSW